jgi:predicted RND superfamily exporter protein
MHRHSAKRPVIERYARFVVARPWWVLALVLAITSVLGLGLRHVQVEVDPDKQLPQSHPYIQTLNEIHRLFGDKNLVIIGLAPTNGDVFSPTFLNTLRRITDAVAALPGVNNQLTQGLASRNVKFLSRTGTDGFSVAPLMPTEPLETATALKTRDRALSDPSLSGTLVSADGSTTAIYATFELSNELPGYVNLHTAVRDTLERYRDGSFTYHLAGPVIVASELTKHASSASLFFVASLVVIGLIHFDAFRTLQSIILPLATGLLAVLWSLGLMGWARISIDPYNATTPVLILAVAAGHAVQILKRYYEELRSGSSNEAAIVSALVHVGPVMIAAGVIASCSFFSLATLGTDSMRTFGLFTGLGIVSALANELTTIPALRAILPRPSDRACERELATHPRIDSALGRLAVAIANPRYARLTLIAYSAIAVGSAALATNIVVDTSFKKNFSSSDPIRLDDELLNSRLAGTNTLLLLVEGDHEGAFADPFALRGLDKLERRLEELPGVGRAISVVDTIKTMHAVLRPDDSVLPDTQQLGLQYLFLYGLSGGDNLGPQLTVDNRIAKVIVMTHEDSTRYGEDLIRDSYRIAAEELPPGYRVRAAGTLASNAALTERMVTGKMSSVAQIALITILVASLILRSILGGIIVAAPLVLAVLFNLGIMGALGVPMDVSTAVIIAMAVGIGADYAVYFVFRLREEYADDPNYSAALQRTMHSSGKAILYVSSAVGFGYAVLCFSGFRIFVQLGSMVGMAMVTSSAGTLSVVPAILTLLNEAGWTERILRPKITLGGRDSLQQASGFHP